jgi:hypothetical protein
MVEGENSNRRDEFDQPILYACIEISQGNPFVQLITLIKKKKKTGKKSF